MPLSTTEAILLSWECCSVIPNADGGGQNNRHTTLLLMTCAPQFRLFQEAMSDAAGRHDPTGHSIKSCSEETGNTLYHTIQYGTSPQWRRRAALFSSASETSFPFMVGEIRREQTRRGICFFLKEGATYCTFTISTERSVCPLTPRGDVVMFSIFVLGGPT